MGGVPPKAGRGAYGATATQKRIVGDKISIRSARPDDVETICRFGAAHIPDHYRPLIGNEAAQAQVDRWWNANRITQAVDGGQVTVAESDDQLVGVAERGQLGPSHVVWKLYLHPDHRGKGLGPEMLRHLIDQLPADAGALQVEVFEANRRADEFYEREGFRYVRTEPHPVNPAMNIVWRELKLDRG